MSSDNYELESRIKKLEMQLTGFAGVSKIESLENEVQTLERKMDSNNSNDTDSKIRSLENEVQNLERKMDSNNSNDTDYKMQSLENEVQNLERKLSDLDYKIQSNTSY